MSTELIAAIKANENSFGIHVSQIALDRIGRYYAFIQEHNAILHLVAPCSAEEFAIRHILESLTILEYLPKNVRLADVGAGAGLPSIPCLLLRDDLRAVLIESKEKKAVFLREVLRDLRIEDRARVVNRQFEEADPANCEVITCRALDKFTGKLPRLLKWAKLRTMLFFGGNSLREALDMQGLAFDEKLLPLSERRYLFIVHPKPSGQSLTSN